MIALDTNILVYARREEATHHAAAKRLVHDLASGDRLWALAWPCVYEFLRVVTHPRVFDPPTDLDVAIEDLESLLDAPSLVLLGEGPAHPAHMARTLKDGRAIGNLAHDAHIVALAIEHGVREIWSTDRDLTRFPGIVARDPFREWELHEPKPRRRPNR